MGFLNKGLSPELAAQVELMLALCERMSLAERQQARGWGNTLALSRNPSKVGRDLAQAKALFGEQFANIAAIFLAERLSSARCRESQSQSDGFDQERQCLALAIKAAKGAAPCWALLSVGEAASAVDVRLCRLLIKEGFPVAGANALGMAAIGMLAGSSAARNPIDDRQPEEMLALLLSHGAGANEAFGVDEKTRFSNLPLRQAQKAYNWSVADKLLDAGADGFARESPGAPCIFEQLVANDRCPLGRRSQAILDQRRLGEEISSPMAPAGVRKPRAL